MMARTGWRGLVAGLCLVVAAGVGLAEPARAADDGARALEDRYRTLAEGIAPSVVGVGVAQGRTDGSGVVVSADGLCLTAADVVPAEASRITVILQGGRRVPAREVGRDPHLGVCLLRADATDLVPAPLGSAVDLRPGRIVLSVGNPYGSISRDGIPAVSVGVVHAFDHVEVDPAVAGSGAPPFPVIQTTAAVNPGSYGGPLLDEAGRVVGIVLPDLSYDRWVGTAVPIDPVRLALPALREGRAPDAGWLGVTANDAPDGVRVVDVVDGSPAARAGLSPDDLILGVDGEPARTALELADGIRLRPAGAPLRLTVRRDGRVHVLWTNLAAAPTPPTVQEGVRPWLGVYLVDEDGRVRVQEVVDGGPADEAGLRDGDVILAWNDRALGSTDDLAEALSGARPGETVTLRVEREGWQRDLELTLGRRGESEARETPEAERASIGFYLVDRDGNVVVQRVVEGSPAAGAGLRSDDVIRLAQLEGRDPLEPLESVDAFADHIEGARPGQTLRLVVERDGWTREFELTLGRADEAPEPAPEPEEPEHPPAAEQGWMGVRLEVRDDGVAIVDVLPESPATRAGLRAGDLIRSIEAGGETVRVEDLDDLHAALRGRPPGEEIVVAVERGDWERRVNLTLGRRPEPPDEPETPEPPEPSETPDAPAAGSGWLGVSLAPARDFLRIREVIEGGPAAESGVPEGGLLVRLRVGDRDPVETTSIPALARYLQGTRPGEEVEMTVRAARNQRAQPRTFRFELGRRPTESGPSEAPEPAPSAEQGIMGIFLRQTGDHLLVEDLVEDGPAARAGVPTPSVIRSIERLAGDRDPLVDPTLRSLQPYMRGARAGERVRLTVQTRGSRPSSFTLTLAPRPDSPAEPPAPSEPPEPSEPEPPEPAPEAQPETPGFLGIFVEPADEGLRVVDVVDGSPAAVADLVDHRVVGVTRPDAEHVSIEEPDDLRRALAGLGPGARVRLELQHPDEQARVVVLALGRRDEDGRSDAPGTLGILVDETDDGLALVGATPGSPAARITRLAEETSPRLISSIRREGREALEEDRLASIEDLARYLEGLRAGERVAVTAVHERRLGGDDRTGSYGVRSRTTWVIRTTATGEESSATPADGGDDGYLGVYLDEVPDADHLRVTEVVPGGPADRAGVRAGMPVTGIVLRRDDRTVRSVGTPDLGAAARALEGARAGDVAVLRLSGREIPVTLGARPDEGPGESSSSSASPPAPSGEATPWLGLAVEPTDGALRVARVVDGGPADGSGLAEGDRIVSIGGEAVSTIDDLAAILDGRRPGDRLRVTVRRNGESRTVRVTLGRLGDR